MNKNDFIQALFKVRNERGALEVLNKFQHLSSEPFWVSEGLPGNRVSTMLGKLSMEYIVSERVEETTNRKARNPRKESERSEREAQIWFQCEVPEGKPDYKFRTFHEAESFAARRIAEGEKEFAIILDKRISPTPFVLNSERANKLVYGRRIAKGESKSLKTSVSGPWMKVTGSKFSFSKG